MRIYVVILIFIFSLQSWTKADDIRDFEIEGMSIGDSALDFFEKSFILKNTWDYPGSNKYKRVQNDNMSFFELYDAVDFMYETKDEKYIMQSLAGIFLTKNMKQCIKKQNSIASDLENAFPNAKKTDQDKIYNDSHWQGSRNRQITFWLDTGIASVHCNDYSKEHGGQDHLAVNLRTNKSNDFLVNEAYK
tara:strand:- start:1574 stop:2143 length:570 start_codon:yes stop_codon:yes gene_type:complete